MIFAVEQQGWVTIGLAVVNMLQIVLLAWLTRGQRGMTQKLNGHLQDHMHG